MINLYIDNKRVDLDDSLDIKITSKMEDVINPTIITTPYSRSLNIPKTPNNNQIFNHYYRIDKKLSINDFSANQRVPYILMDNQEILMKGYLKINTITNLNYEITLFDELTNTLKKMEEKLLVDALPNMNHTINRNTVISSWNFDPVSTNNTGSIYDYITYCPAYKGTYDNFNSSKIENVTGGTTDLGFEVDEYDQNEFRSYYQQPCIYYNKIIKSICDANNIRLDSGFHNDTNPYWKNTVVMFPKLINSSSQSSYFSTDGYGQINYVVNSNGTKNSGSADGIQKFNTVSDPYDINNITSLELTKYPAGEVKIDYEFQIKLKLYGPTAWSGKTVTILARTAENYVNNRFRIAFYFPGQRNKNNANLYTVGPNLGDIRATLDSNGDGYFSIDNDPIFTIRGTSIVPSTLSAAELRFTIDALVDGNIGEIKTIAIRELGQSANLTGSSFYIRSEVVNANLSFCNITNTNVIRSDAFVNKSNIIPSSLKQGSFLLQHIKMFGLVLDKDKDGFIIKSRNKYYQEGKILNWSNKVDYSKEMDLQPIGFDKRYQLFKYEPNDTTHYKTYSTISDIAFADFRIDTSFEFNDDKNELYKSQFNAPLISQEYTLNRNINKWERMPYVSPAMHTIDKEKKVKAEAKMTLLFKYPRVVLPYWKDEAETIKSLVYVSDDTTGMTANNEFYWQPKTTNTIAEYKIGLDNPLFPYFNSVSPDFNYSLEFGKNKLYYNLEMNDVEYSENATLYNRLHSKWCEDRYDVNTKLLTCYVYLTRGEFMKLKLNSFVIIDNTLFIINKINDFNLLQDGVTKVDLIKINDINNYLYGQDIVSQSYLASTFTIDINTGQLVETRNGNEDITFSIINNDLYYNTDDVLINTTLTIQNNNLIQNQY